jgi:hypothetical protein
MSKDESKARSGGQGAPAGSDDRLAANARVSRKMKPFVNRMRLRLEHLDLTDPAAVQRLDHARKEMREILERKNVPEAAAEWAITRALDAAADYQIQILRSEESHQSHARAKTQLRRLTRHIEQLSKAITKLPPVSKGELNRLIAEKTWTEFDAEAFGQLFQELLGKLSGISPDRLATDARVAIRESLDCRNDPVVAWNNREAPPALIELWECIPDATRLTAETELRAWRPPTRGQSIAFLDQLRALLAKNGPKPGPGRRGALVNTYLKKIATIWQRLNLKVGLARGGSRLKSAESSVQQFSRLALEGIGDNSAISVRQIGNLKKDRRAKMQ